jgi:hypothetical protein
LKTDSHGLLTHPPSFVCLQSPGSSTLAFGTRLGGALQLGRSILPVFILAHSMERWSTLQGAEFYMNAVFFDIILTPPKTGIVQISPQKELSHNIRRLSLQISNCDHSIAVLLGA